VSNSIQSTASIEPTANAGLASSSVGQTAFTIVTTVAKERLPDLTAYLDSIGNDIKGTTEIRFRDYETLHFCSIQIIADPLGNDAPLLVFEGNIDGATRPFFTLLAQRNRAFLQRVFAACVGFPANAPAADVVDYLLANDQGANAFYVGQPGAIRSQIERDRDLRVRLESEIDRRATEFAALPPEGCLAQLVEYVKSQPDLAWVQLPAPTLGRVRYGKVLFYGIVALLLVVPAGLLFLALWPTVDWSVRIAAAAALGAMAILIAGYLVWLRYREAHDQQDDTLPLPEFVARLQLREDVQPLNHLVSVTDVKPGLLRILTLRTVLYFINLLARYIATQGDLGGIVTIHFARWVILNPPGATRTRLLFLSNYDGSFENYLGEFIDRASAGLTAVWSNTQLAADRGFPNTQWLFVSGGSRDEQRFKNYARLSQQTGGIWYSAYPTLSMKQITNNREIRLGLSDASVNAADWLRRF
jgi:hypothetical protein